MARPSTRTPEWAANPPSTPVRLEVHAQLPTAGVAPLRRVELSGRRAFVLGRVPELTDVALAEEPSISRQHALLVHGCPPAMVPRAALTLIDLGSANGTFVRAASGALARVTPHQPRAVRPGDVLRFGEAKLTCLVTGLPEPEPASAAKLAESAAGDSGTTPSNPSPPPVPSAVPGAKRPRFDAGPARSAADAARLKETNQAILKDLEREYQSGRQQRHRGRMGLGS